MARVGEEGRRPEAPGRGVHAPRVGEGRRRPHARSSKGLESADHHVRGTAATALLEYGTPGGDAAKPALLKALKEADAATSRRSPGRSPCSTSRSAFDEVLEEYRVGHLAKVQRLDGNPAFDPEQLAGDGLRSTSSRRYATDESESVRQLVATVLSRNADPKWTDTLIKLVQDKCIDVAREAAVGLGKIANEQSMQPLLGALDKADKDSRSKFLEALRDGVGGKRPRARAAERRQVEARHEKFQTKQIFDMLRELEDPRARRRCSSQYIDDEPAPALEDRGRPPPRRDRRSPRRAHARVAHEAGPAQALQQGRAIPITARTTTSASSPRACSPTSPSSTRTSAPTIRTRGLRRRLLLDDEQAAAARQRAPLPGGVRARRRRSPRCASGRTRRTPFPKEGQQEFPPVWATAQSALRYLGWMQGSGSAWAVLEHAAQSPAAEGRRDDGIAPPGRPRRPRHEPPRASASARPHGFAQWGDPKAYPILVKYIEDTLNNEQSRYEACFSLSLGRDRRPDEGGREEGEGATTSRTRRAQLIRELLPRDARPPPGARRRRPASSTSSTATLDPQVQHQAARAIGFGGIDAEHHAASSWRS